jgi:hypothetical protein
MNIVKSINNSPGMMMGQSFFPLQNWSSFNQPGSNLNASE